MFLNLKFWILAWLSLLSGVRISVTGLLDVERNEPPELICSSEWEARKRLNFVVEEKSHAKKTTATTKRTRHQGWMCKYLICVNLFFQSCSIILDLVRGWWCVPDFWIFSSFEVVSVGGQFSPACRVSMCWCWCLPGKSPRLALDSASSVFLSWLLIRVPPSERGLPPSYRS